MLSHKVFVITLLFIIASVSIGLIAIAIVQKKCFQPDKKICTALRQLEKESFTQVHGTYIEHGKGPVFHSEWILNDSRKQIIYRDDTKETMNIVFTPEKVYMKDLSDTAWWEQSNNSVQKFHIQLPFDPEVFISFIIKKMQKDRVAFINHVSIACPPLNEGSCIRYTLHDPSDKDVTEYVYLSSNGLLHGYTRKNGDTEKEFFIYYEAEKIELPDYTKKPKEDQNIFLESSLHKKTEPQGLQLDYVREFQMQMGNDERASEESAF